MKENISVRRVDVTPQIAQKWLDECNTHNRTLYETTVDAYARDMKRGFWALNHQGICFSEDSVLLDGQHRLAAVVRSEKTVPFYVFRGMPKEFQADGSRHLTQETVDGNKPRGVGDRLALAHGIGNANLKVAVAAVLINICTGKSVKMTPAVVLEVLGIYAGEVEAVLENRSTARGLGYAPVLGAFAFAAKCFKDKVLEFERAYFSGENLSSGSPILAFRNYMLNRPPGVVGQSHRRAVQNHALNCLMYYVKGQPLSRLASGIQGHNFFEYKESEVVEEIRELIRL